MEKIAQIEVNRCFTDKFGQHVLQEPVAGAICISHLRALNEALNQNEDASIIVVLEGDVMGNDNTVQLFASLVANWFCNDE